MSMIGLAASPGTDVLPMCSSRRNREPTAVRISVLADANCSGQAAS
jgi:hypothetical protein